MKHWMGFPNADMYESQEASGGESFWPSFTDIMMVIVMAFLLVTVTVVLNNWQLVKNLKASIEAERLAATEAQKAMATVETKQLENETLEQRVVRLEHYISSQANLIEQGEINLAETQAKLEASQESVKVKEQELAGLKVDQASTLEQLNAITQQLDDKSSDLNTRLATIELLNQQLDEKSTTLQNIQTTLSEKTAQLGTLQTTANEQETEVGTLQTQIAKQENEIGSLQTQLSEKGTEVGTLQTQLTEAKNKLVSLQTRIDETTVALNTQESEAATFREKVLEKERILTANTEQLSALQVQVESKEEQITQLKEQVGTTTNLEETLQLKEQQVVELQERLGSLEQANQQLTEQNTQTTSQLTSLRDQSKDGHEKLLSLQGEFDELDKKYQKLLRPARSSKGKHIATVIYRKKAGKKQYQVQNAPGEAINVVSKSQMDKRLAALKEKYGDDLYIKIIIPENSGLSYNEAWAFTKSTLQTYDYYHQEE